MSPTQPAPALSAPAAPPTVTELPMFARWERLYDNTRYRLNAYRLGTFLACVALDHDRLNAGHPDHFEWWVEAVGMDREGALRPGSTTIAWGRTTDVLDAGGLALRTAGKLASAVCAAVQAAPAVAIAKPSA